MIRLSTRAKIGLGLSFFITILFFIIQSLVVFRILDCSYDMVFLGWICICIFIPSMGFVTWDVLEEQKIQKLKKISLEEILEESCLVSKANARGIITEVNDKFCEVSGYPRQELIGQDHNILNSGFHPPEFWSKMYETTVKYKTIWFATVRNKRKNGSIYVVNSWIRANFDELGNHTGFISVRQDITELSETMESLKKKNKYLEHSAKILRHDMHSGINTYLPRGLRSLERRLKPEQIEELKLESPLKLLKEGLEHTQRVYEGVKEFTNLVKEGSVLEKKEHDLAEILRDYLSRTAYSDQVAIDWLPKAMVNAPLFCTAIDNMIRNGLKYNDSEFKMVAITMVDDFHLAILDNGRGMSQEDFDRLSKPYVRNENQKESGTGLGLDITNAILQEHGFSMSVHLKEEGGTMIKVKIR